MFFPNLENNSHTPKKWTFFSNLQLFWTPVFCPLKRQGFSDPKQGQSGLMRIFSGGWTIQSWKLMTINTVGHDTVDGRNPKQPAGMYKNPVNNAITYQPQLVIAGFLNHQEYLTIIMMKRTIKKGQLEPNYATNYQDDNNNMGCKYPPGN